MSKRVALLTATVVALTVSVLGAPAALGIPAPTAAMSGTPNPATVGDLVTVSNDPGDANTCVGGIIYYQVLDPSSSPVDSGTTAPDGSGNWSISFTATMVGTYLVNATCEVVESLDAGPAATPTFVYIQEAVLVQLPPSTTTSTSTSTTAPTSTSTAVAATAVTPAFTG